MVRLLIYLLAISLLAVGLGWLADRPGSLEIVWQGYDIETSVFRAVVLLAAAAALLIFLWSMFRTVWQSPALIGQRMLRHRQKRGLEALSSGLIAAGAGDATLASRFALQARKSLPHEPLTHLLRAQSAELSGDRAAARRIYEAMLASPETEQFGLRGLFLEAQREGAGEAARQFAARALNANPKLGWPSNALFEQQCKQKDWTGALATIEQARKNGHVAKAATDRKRAVLLTAKALEAEEDAPDKALTLALEAHALAPDLVPAAALAGHILASRGNTGKAAKILQKTWTKSPHPDLATAYAYARVGDSTRDRFDRIRQLAALSPHSIESPIAVATAAVEAQMYGEARRALEPLLQERLTQRVALLMARIEGGENGEKGRVREWLARAMNAARDPAWIADGVISDHWEPISPVDGRLDCFQWRVPVETRDTTRSEILARRLDELVSIAAPSASAVVMQATTATEEPKAAGSTQPDVIEAEPVTVAVQQVNGGAPNGSHAAGASDAAIEETPGDLKATRTLTGRRRTPEDRNQRKRKEDKSFASPPSPDDPGPEPSVAENDVTKVRNLRAMN